MVPNEESPCLAIKHKHMEAIAVSASSAVVKRLEFDGGQGRY